MMQAHELSKFIKSEALRLGFDVCGIAPAAPVPQETADGIDKWIARGCHGGMHYLERNREKRYNPAQLVDGCRSIVCAAMNYCPTETDSRRLHLSRYALGRDYHKVVKDRLYILLESIGRVHPVKGRPFCDSAPVLERHWAVQAGIGWIGKNRQLIIPGSGSYFFLGELFIDAVAEYDTPIGKRFCGNCTACIDNCPTQALGADGFDARKCLSYLTIEHRGELPENIGEMMGNCFYGCDRCQSACPHNRFSRPTAIEEFAPKKELSEMSDEDWMNIDEERYRRLFADSAVERCGYEQLKRNIVTCTARRTPCPASDEQPTNSLHSDSE